MIPKLWERAISILSMPGIRQEKRLLLSRLKGHLQKGMWITKIRKQMRKEEMTRDLVLASVPKEKQETYVRIMPTSPP